MNPFVWTLADILSAAAGERIGGRGEQTFSGISIDSRRILPDEIFVAIQGEVHDGHKFAGDVVQSGVKGLVLEQGKLKKLPWQDWDRQGVICIAVPDTLKALGDLAVFNRNRAGISVIALTGSNGKTSTRSMTGGVISQRYPTLTTEGNFNNEIGLPLTLFRLTPAHRWAVLELGMNHPGEIRRLARMCRPDIGLITSIAPAHLAGVGTVEGVVSAKGELVEELGPGAVAILNADCLYGQTLAQKTSEKVLFFGQSQNADIRASDVRETEKGISFTLTLPQGIGSANQTTIHLNTPGRFMVSNALAAAAAGYAIGLSAGDIQAGLEKFTPVRGRMNLYHTQKGIHIIDDTYNANPESMRAALETLHQLKGPHRGVFAAGSMFELGDHSAYLHRMVGGYAGAAGVETLLAAGQFAQDMADGAAAAGISSQHIFIGGHEDIIRELKTLLRPGDWLLVKGSRGMAMEKVLNPVREWADNL